MPPPSPARQGAAVDQAGGYAPGVTGSTIHNFRSYLHFLAPGGCFHLIEGHPFALIFDDRPQTPELRMLYPYFQGREPIREEQEGSYAAPNAPIHSVQHVWIHSLADVIGSLLRAGLQIESFAEYPYVAWKMFPWMTQRTDGSWELPGGAATLPLMFSLSARK